MKEPKAMKEVHEAMVKLYEEIEDLSPEDQVKKIRDESEELLRKYHVQLKRIKRHAVTKA